MKNNYIIEDFLNNYNKRYSWYQDVYNGKIPRYKMDKSRPYDDADYYYAKSYDKNTWFLYFKGKQVGVEIIGIENTNNTLIAFNKDISSRIMYD